MNFIYGLTFQTSRNLQFFHHANLKKNKTYMKIWSCCVLKPSTVESVNDLSVIPEKKSCNIALVMMHQGSTAAALSILFRLVIHLYRSAGDAPGYG